MDKIILDPSKPNFEHVIKTGVNKLNYYNFGKIMAFIEFSPCPDENLYYLVEKVYVDESYESVSTMALMLKCALIKLPKIKKAYHDKISHTKFKELLEKQKDFVLRVTKDKEYYYINKPIRVFIMGRDQFKRVMEMNDVTNDNVEKKDIFFISINNNNEPNYKPHFENKNNVLVQYFDDVEFDIVYPRVGDPGNPIINKAFTEEQGKELIAFVEKNTHKSQCILHCTAGVSRSGAVGTFVNFYLGGDYEVFKRDNPHISPNPHVISTLDKLTR